MMTERERRIAEIAAEHIGELREIAGYHGSTGLIRLADALAALLRDPSPGRILVKQIEDYLARHAGNDSEAAEILHDLQSTYLLRDPEPGEGEREAWLSPVRPDGLVNLNHGGACIATGLKRAEAEMIVALINRAPAPREAEGEPEDEVDHDGLARWSARQWKRGAAEPVQPERWERIPGHGNLSAPPSAEIKPPIAHIGAVQPEPGEIRKPEGQCECGRGCAPGECALPVRVQPESDGELLHRLRQASNGDYRDNRPGRIDVTVDELETLCAEAATALASLRVRVEKLEREREFDAVAHNVDATSLRAIADAVYGKLWPAAWQTPLPDRVRELRARADDAEQEVEKLRAEVEAWRSIGGPERGKVVAQMAERALTPPDTREEADVQTPG